MTLAELRDELIRLIKYASDYDPNTPLSLYTALLNRAYIKICGEADHPHERTTLPVPANTETVRVSRLRKTLRVWWIENNTQRPLLPLRIRHRPEDTFAEYILTNDAFFTPGIPHSYEARGNRIRLIPIPNTSAQLHVEGIFVPSLLTLDTDEPDLPDNYHDLIYKLAYRYYLDPYPERAQERLLLEREIKAGIADLRRDLRTSLYSDTLNLPSAIQEVWRLR